MSRRALSTFEGIAQELRHVRPLRFCRGAQRTTLLPAHTAVLVLVLRAAGLGHVAPCSCPRCALLRALAPARLSCSRLAELAPA